MSELFSMLDFAGEEPTYAVGCMYCHLDIDTGEWTDRETHEHTHLPITCGVCGCTEPNRLLFEMSHTVTLGGCWKRGALVCTRLDLNLNHWSYAMLHGYEEPVSPAGDLCIRLGWRFAPDGYAVPPAGWPSGDVHSMEPIEALS